MVAYLVGSRNPTEETPHLTADSAHMHVPVIVPGCGALLGPVLQSPLPLLPKKEFGLFLRPVTEPVTENNESEDEDCKNRECASENDDCQWTRFYPFLLLLAGSQFSLRGGRALAR